MNEYEFSMLSLTVRQVLQWGTIILNSDCDFRVFPVAGVDEDHRR